MSYVPDLELATHTGPLVRTVSGIVRLVENYDHASVTVEYPGLCEISADLSEENMRDLRDWLTDLLGFWGSA